jgi:hypothetical protein
MGKATFKMRMQISGTTLGWSLLLFHHSCHSKLPTSNDSLNPLGQMVFIVLNCLPRKQNADMARELTRREEKIETVSHARPVSA